ncbi:MAG: AMP-binding enzyme, partial [Rhodoferax sp.]
TKWGEAVHAVVVMRPGASAGPDALSSELRAHCLTRLGGYKCPRSFSFVQALPMSAAGKILKNVLRDQQRP